VRPIDERRELGHGELGAQLVGLRRGEPARGHHFPDVNAALGVLSDCCAHVASHRAAEEVAVTAGGRDRRSRRHHAWQVRGHPESQRPVAAVAQISDGRHAGRGMSAKGLHDHHVDRLVGHGPGALEPTEGGVRDQMSVAVEQPW
jgi:hypothetical protein